MGVCRNFPGWDNVDILLILFRLLTMQMDVHETLYSFYTTKKMLHVTITTVTKVVKNSLK